MLNRLLSQTLTIRVRTLVVSAAMLGIGFAAGQRSITAPAASVEPASNSGRDAFTVATRRPLPRPAASPESLDPAVFGRPFQEGTLSQERGLPADGVRTYRVPGNGQTETIIVIVNEARS